MEIIDILFTASFWAAAIRIASPLIFATLGELICERAGVLNLGIEGIMVVGAFAGWMAVYSGTGLWVGVGVAMLVGMLFGLLHSILTVPFGLSQHVVGLGVTLLATSSTYYAYRLALPEVTSPPKIEAFQPFEIPILSDIPLIGPALFSQTPFTYLAFVLVAVVAVVLYRTPLGLAVRAAGENPAAVAAQGLSVTAIRMGAVVVGSGFMAMGERTTAYSVCGALRLHDVTRIARYEEPVEWSGKAAMAGSWQGRVPAPGCRVGTASRGGCLSSSRRGSS